MLYGAVAIACAVNIVGDLMLVGVFHMAAAGAAIATVLAQLLSVVLSLSIITRQKLPFTVKKEDFRFHGDRMWEVLKLGFPIALQDALVNVSFLVITAIVNSLGGCDFSGDRCFVMLQGIIGAFMVRIPVSFFMSNLEPVDLFKIGLATPSSTAVQIALCVIYFYWMGRKVRSKKIIPPV